MARKDETLRAFLEHPLLTDKYDLSESEKQLSLREAMKSDKPIIKALAMVVDEKEDGKVITDNRLYDMTMKYLQTSVR